MDCVQPIRPIARGYAYRLRLVVEADGGAPVFPVGCAIRSELRDYVGAAILAGALDSSGGGIVRVNDATIDIDIPPAVTAKLDNDTATLDLVRTDLGTPEWMGVRVMLPVQTAVTKPLS